MLQLSTVGELRQLDVKSIFFSETRAQLERRKQFDKKSLDELAENIKHQGVVVPIIVRPTKPFEIVQDSAPNTTWSIWRQDGTRKTHGDPVVGRFDTRDEAEAKLLELIADSDHFELIAGERRLLAARKAGLVSIPAIVRNVTASQAHEIQLIENLQREDLHELAEAEGYEALLKRGMSADEIADKMAKSKSHVYARMKLIALSEKCRAAFYEGKINASVALLLARVPVHELQDKAIDKILKPNDYARDPMTYRDAQRYMQDEFTLKLSQAPFPKDDETLVPGAGTCAACPKRTGNQPADLFGDIKSADVCTDPVCFKEKKAAHMKRQLEKAKETGQPVIRGAAAKRILPNAGHWYSSDGSHKQLRNGYARPSDKCLDDPKKRTFAELVGKDAPMVLVQDPETGRVQKAIPLEQVADKLKEAGVKFKKAENQAERTEQDRAAEEAKRKFEEKVRIATFAAIRKAAPAKLLRGQLEQLVCAQLIGADLGSDDIPAFFEACGLSPPKGNVTYANRDKVFLTAAAAASDADLNRLAAVALLVDDVFGYYGSRDRLNEAAKQFGVDLKTVRAEVEAAEAKPAEKAKSAQKPATKKAKKAKAAKKK